MKQDPIEQVRSEWKVEPRVNATFRPEVWSRIEARRSESRSFAGWLRAHFKFATAAAGTGVLAAALLGLALARQSAPSRTDKLEAYLTSIDPHRQIASTDHQ
jgi:hypothetical protein